MDGLLKHATSPCLRFLSSSEATLWLHLLVSISAPTWLLMCGQSSKVENIQAPDWGCRRRYAWTSYKRLAWREPAIAKTISTFAWGDASVAVLGLRGCALPKVHKAWLDRGLCLNLIRKYPTLIFVGCFGWPEGMDESVPLSSLPPMTELKFASWVTKAFPSRPRWTCGRDLVSSSKANKAWSLLGWISMTLELKLKFGTDATGIDCDWIAAMMMRARDWYDDWSFDMRASHRKIWEFGIGSELITGRTRPGFLTMMKFTTGKEKAGCMMIRKKISLLAMYVIASGGKR